MIKPEQSYWDNATTIGDNIFELISRKTLFKMGPAYNEQGDLVLEYEVQRLTFDPVERQIIEPVSPLGSIRNTLCHEYKRTNYVLDVVAASKGLIDRACVRDEVSAWWPIDRLADYYTVDRDLIDAYNRAMGII